MKAKILRKTRSLSELGRISPNNNRFFLSIDQDIIGCRDENNIKRIGIKSPVFSIPEFTFDKKNSSKNKNKKYKDIFDHEFSSIAVNEFMTMMYNR